MGSGYKLVWIAERCWGNIPEPVDCEFHILLTGTLSVKQMEGCGKGHCRQKSGEGRHIASVSKAWRPSGGLARSFAKPDEKYTGVVQTGVFRTTPMLSFHLLSHHDNDWRGEMWVPREFRKEVEGLLKNNFPKTPCLNPQKIHHYLFHWKAGHLLHRLGIIGLNHLQIQQTFGLSVE